MLKYAIADVHGCLAHLVEMLRRIEEHAAGREHQIITLGDYVDRGPDSKGVMDLIMSRPDIIALKGNHEDMMYIARAGRFSETVHWTSNGGDAALKSFGVAGPHLVPSEYYDLIRDRLRLYYEDELRVFVHAGINPNLPMNQQKESFMLWVREPVLNMVDPFPKYVVHGHTPYVYDPRRSSDRPEPIVLNNRINLDTGCVFSGVLSCAVFDDSQAQPIDLILVKTSEL